jgi:hypothetical protein
MPDQDNESSDSAFGGRRASDLVKTIGGIVGLIIVVVSATMWFGGLGTQLSVLQSRVDAQDVKIESNTEAISRILSLLTDIKVDVAAIKGALGIKN